MKPLLAVLLLSSPASAEIVTHNIAFYWASSNTTNHEAPKSGDEKKPHPNPGLTDRWVADHRGQGGAVEQVVWAGSGSEPANAFSHVMRIRLLNASERLAATFIIRAGNKELVKVEVPPVSRGRYANPGTLEVYDRSIACEGQSQGGRVDPEMGYVCLRVDGRRLRTAAGRNTLNLSVIGTALNMEQVSTVSWTVSAAGSPYDASSW